MKTKLSKKYYVPGIISAILIPLVFWYCASRYVDKTVYTVVDLGLPVKSDPNRDKEFPEYTFETYRDWNYKKIIVQPNSALKNQKYYISELKKLQQVNQRETGIEFVIGEKNTYQDFIVLIDAMILAKQDFYGVDMDKTGHFFAVHIVKDKNFFDRGIDVVYGNDNIFNYKENVHYKGFSKFKYVISQLPQNTFYIIFGFLLFLNVAILNIRKFL